VNWLKKSKTLTYEEGCVAHLVGLRMCLFPWYFEFLWVDNLLSNYLNNLKKRGWVLTPFTRDCLHARFTERELAILHTRMESLDFFSRPYIRPNYSVLKGIFRRIKEHSIQTTETTYPIYQSMTTSGTRKINAILDKLEKQSTLSSDGRAWLIAACDPFHDTDITLAGYPDVNTSSTVVQLIKKSVQVTTTALGNFDCCIAMFPTMAASGTINSSTVNAAGVIIGVGASSTIVTGGIVIVTGDSGVGTLWPTATQNVNGTHVSYQSLALPEYIKGDVRIIGMAFEVVNTTSQLNKQGQVIAWRMPTNNTPMELYAPLTSAAGTSVVGYSGLLHRFPPGTPADAELLYGSRSWAAGEGSYTVARQNSENNPLRAPDTLPDWYTGGDMVFGATSTVYTGPSPGVGAVGPKGGVDIHAPYDLSGTWYTGLSNSSTLTVHARWLIERSPGPSEADLVVLATPSSAYDPLALELYTHCLDKMPPGVMLSENALGDWFRDALSTVSTWAPKIGNVLGNFLPGASLVGNAIGSGAGIVREFIPAETKIPLQGSASKQGQSTRVVQMPRQIVYRAPQRFKPKPKYTRKNPPPLPPRNK